jgi:hypothetical protein
MENVENNDHTSMHLEADLRFFRRWVKDELFKGCKFLTNGKKSLEKTGSVYARFRSACFENLLGVKNITDDNMVQKELYFDLLWVEGNKQHVISNGLALRRSAVYTVMLNKFMGKLKCYLPSRMITHGLTLTTAIHCFFLLQICVNSAAVDA